MEIERLRRDFQVQITYFEEALLKNDAENLLAEQGLGTRLLQRRRNAISRVDANEVRCVGYARESEQVQGTVHGIYGEKSRVCGAAHIVLHAIKPVRDVDVGDSSQWAAAQPPIQRGEPARKRAQGFLLGDIRLQRLKVGCAHGILVAGKLLPEVNPQTYDRAQEQKAEDDV